MAISYRTQGFVLKKADFLEADRILTIYTKDFGKLEILAKGLRKIKSKLRGEVELFCLSDIEFVLGKVYKTLIDASLINNFGNTRKDLNRLKLAYKVSQISIDFLKGEERDENLWKLFNEFFQELNSIFLTKKELLLLYYYFFWNFFSILGYKIELQNCSLCQKKLKPDYNPPTTRGAQTKVLGGRREGGVPQAGPYLYFKEGGVICSQCFKKEKKGKRIDINLIKILRLILKRDFETLKKIKVKITWQRELKMMSESYLSFLKGLF